MIANFFCSVVTRSLLSIDILDVSYLLWSIAKKQDALWIQPVSVINSCVCRWQISRLLHIFLFDNIAHYKVPTTKCMFDLRSIKTFYTVLLAINRKVSLYISSKHITCIFLVWVLHSIESWIFFCLFKIISIFINHTGWRNGTETRPWSWCYYSFKCSPKVFVKDRINDWIETRIGIPKPC